MPKLDLEKSRTRFADDVKVDDETKEKNKTLAKKIVNIA
jgi:hypothetical protein